MPPSLSEPSSRDGRWRQLLLIAAIALVVVLFFALGLHRQLSLEGLQRAHGALLERQAQAPVLMAGIYMLIYVLVTALSLPGAAVLTLAGGAIFGLGLGTLLVSFASSAGALLAFLVARTLLRDLVRRRFGRQLAPIDAGRQLLSHQPDRHAAGHPGVRERRHPAGPVARPGRHP